MKILMLVGLFLALNQGTQAAKVHKVQNYYNYYNGVGGTNGNLLVKLMKSLLAKLNALSSVNPVTQCAKKHYVPKNCYEVLKKCGLKKSGVYSVDPDGKGKIKVYCDQKTAGGGWTVFQRRQDGSVDFYRGWADYKKGFGNLNGEFWLGLDAIHRLTQQTKNRLRVDLEDTKGKTAYAEYDSFGVASERVKYRLSIGKYSGNAGDSLSRQANQPFTTKDSSNSSCAKQFKGAWWYESCHNSNLNGLYHHGKHKSYADGVNWSQWRGYHYSLKRTEMKTRPKI